MFEPLAVPAINRLLRASTWALEKLRPHAGRTVRLECAPAELVFTITAAGEVAAAASSATPDATISVTPGVLLRLAARDESAWNAAQVSGDVELAAAIDSVCRNLEWDYEEDLSRLFGDVAAHRMAQGLRELDRWGRATALNLAEAFAEYATHEQPTLALRRAVEAFNRDVDEVRDHAARLEKRLELLRRRLDGN
jgi:ubiquinone biosynthesis protein UbiJ